MSTLTVPKNTASLIPGIDGRTRQTVALKKIRADNLVGQHAALEQLTFDFTNVEPLHAQGDMWVHDDNGEVVALSIGSNDQVLRADSTTAEGIAWTLDPTTLLTETGDLLSFAALPEPGAYIALAHPGEDNQGYVLSAADPTVPGESGLGWRLPTLLPVIEPVVGAAFPVNPFFTVSDVAAAGVIPLESSSGLATGTFTIQGMYTSPGFFRIELSFADAIAVGGSDSTVFFNPFSSNDGPFPDPLIRVDRGMVSTQGVLYVDSFAIAVVSGLNQGIYLAPDATHDATAEWLSGDSFTPQSFAFEYPIALV
jgi:hypothetical protein